MRVAIFDLETSSLYANTGILLCACIKAYGEDKVTTIRADEFPEWETNRSNNEPVIRKALDVLLGGNDPEKGFDIFVAHNGMYFDRAMLNTWALKYKLPITLRFSRMIDPVMLLRRHCRLASNSLASAIDFFDIPHKKTPVDFSHWQRAALDGNRKSLGYIVEHCKYDVRALEALYNIAKRLVKGIDEKGSSF